MTHSPPWQIWIDRGGTFTDVVARRPDGVLTTTKTLSEDPTRQEDAAIAAIRQLTGVAHGPLPPCAIRMGTTVATNALLERKGEPTLLAITRGFGDALTIGTQERPEIFARALRLPMPPHARVVEIDERVMADGTVLRALDADQAHAALSAAYADGLRSVAIVLMHGYRYQAHEQALAEIARAIGFTQISVSHEASALIKLIGRGDTTLVDAYLSPILRRYIDQFRDALGPDSAPLFMQSSGGLADHQRFRGKDAILSGPAGGIVGMVGTAAALGKERLIGFDMGGTSTDVSHYAGQLERENESMVAGTRIRAPMLRIHTVAAGGGSICRFERGRMLVGPQSAGAVPGPAAYRRGGPLTVTDCNVLLGKIQPAHFPHLFGPTGTESIDREIVAQKFAAMAKDVHAASGVTMSAAQLAQGFLAIAVANMANAIKKITVARGHDVTAGYALVCFGGAGGQHACLVADALGIDEVLIHPFAGVLSAYGMGLARQSHIVEETLALDLLGATSAATLEATRARLEQAASQALLTGNMGEAPVRLETLVFLRAGVSENCVALPIADRATLASGFAAAFRQQFGYASDGALVVDRIRVEATVGGVEGAPIAAMVPAQSAPPIGHVPVHLPGGADGEQAREEAQEEERTIPLYDRGTLAAGWCANGPCLIIDPMATTMVEPGWQATVETEGTLRLSRAEAAAESAGAASVAADDWAEAEAEALATPDPVRLEIFNALFMAIAEEMGAALQHSAMSVNIRERLDFSCALFDSAGRLVANAPHMPVHLGSMGESVRTILTRTAQGGRPLQRGDVYALNAPYDGGTHLPDITVIAPVFVAGDSDCPSYFVAARGHHADIGGISPGSMPPDSRSVEEEGIIFDAMLIVEDGVLREEAILERLRSGRWPSRNPALNIADLKAQIAACARGIAELDRLCARNGRATITAYMAHGQAQAEEAVRQLIGRLRDGQFCYGMDNGAQICVAVTIDQRTRGLTIDFTGTSAQLPDNFNAPLPVVRAAILYVLRTMVDDAIPMNDGCLAPVTIIMPDHCMLSPRYPAAVVAGNVETSQVVTDALFGAFGAMAGAQGTMNNFTFGDDAHQYYETIAGGAGAGPDFDGASAVQTHMTNSRLTDPEILETRFPVLLEEFSIRRGSGGNGAHKGGDGVVRRVRFLKSMRAGILSNRRIVPPFGLAGGEPGALGRNSICRADGSTQTLPATASAALGAGDCFTIETPGGGGYGAAEQSITARSEGQD
jgi:5-oxoprolinase (ATP-hydrolysing)